MLYIMNLFALLSLFSSVITFLLANFIFYKGKKNLQNKIFILACLTLSYWGFFEFMGRQAVDYASAYFWVKLTIPWPFTIAFFFHFVLVFTEKTALLHHKFIYMLIYLPVPFFSYIDGFTNLISNGVTKEYWGYTYILTENSWVSTIADIWIFSLVFLSLILYLHYYWKIQEKRRRIWTSYLAISYAFIILGGIVTERILPWLHIKFPPSTVVSMTIMSAIICYAIWKYELFTIDTATAAGTLITTMPDSLLLINAKREIEKINPSFCRIFEYREEDVIGKPIEILFGNMNSLETIFNKLSTKGQLLDYEIIMKARTGKFIPVLFSGSVIKNKRNKTIGIVCIAHDITERKLTENELLLFNRKLQQNNQELKDFVYVASHDLQEPLRKINTFGERLKGKYSIQLETQGLDYLNRIMSAVIRMQKLIDDLLAYSQITITDRPFIKVDLSQIVNGVLSDLESQIERTGGRVETDPLPVINANPTQIRQLFQNLISNGLKFHKPGEVPVVKVYTMKDTFGKYCRLIVEDNGIGIAEHDYKRIFGVFSRLHGKSEYEGSGIGLAICKKIVEKHRGTIQVESQKEAGTKFIINLPI